MSAWLNEVPRLTASEEADEQPNTEESEGPGTVVAFVARALSIRGCCDLLPGPKRITCKLQQNAIALAKVCAMKTQVIRLWEIVVVVCRRRVGIYIGYRDELL